MFYITNITTQFIFVTTFAPCYVSMTHLDIKCVQQTGFLILAYHLISRISGDNKLFNYFIDSMINFIYKVSHILILFFLCIKWVKLSIYYSQLVYVHSINIEKHWIYQNIENSLFRNIIYREPLLLPTGELISIC